MRYFKILFLLIIGSLLLNSCSNVRNEKDYITKVYDNLNHIKNVSYNSTIEVWAPFDTLPSHTFYSFRKEFNNPSDSTIGASFVTMSKDKSQVNKVYDGNMTATIFHENKSVLIDSFKLSRNTDFRPITAPFFNYAKSILRYALNTNDSVVYNYQDLDSLYYFKLTIYEDHQVEFFGKAYYMPQGSYDYGDRTSQYEIWIDKEIDLPIKIRREMSHNISVEYCNGVKVNELNTNELKAINYLPEEYEYREYGVDNQKIENSKLIGKLAPKWILKSDKNKVVSLDDLESKFLILQFTSVNCGACKLSVPFLNKLSALHNPNDVRILAIECSTKSLQALKHYRVKNEISYKLLHASKEVIENYSVKSYPTFYLLDENRKVVKVITGYKKGKTDIEIKKIINEHI